MSDTPWTPGPWTAEEMFTEVGWPTWKIVSPKEQVAEVNTEREADARLIALAPEMAGIMEFLADPETPTWDMEMGDCVLCGAPGVSTYQGKPHTRNCVVTESRTLLARARGETA